MAQLFIYQRVVPVSPQRHRNLYVKAGTDFGFARRLTVVPLTPAEFPEAAAELPIVFGSEADPVPMAALGVRDRENLFVGGDGRWTGRYVPAFLRRYPFVFSNSADGKTFTLCLDEGFAGFNTEGRGERMFDAEGNRTQFLEGVISFVDAHRKQHEQALALARRLGELNLLEPMNADINLVGGQKLKVTGFRVVSRQRLAALPVETLGEMARSGELEAVYLHLQSLRNFSGMLDRLGALVAAAPPAAAAS